MDEAGWKRFKETAKEWARFNTFEGRVEQLEAICQRIPGTWPNRPLDAHPDKYSQPWYAEEILRVIRFVRHHLERGHASHAAAEALTAGVLAAEAGARLKWQEMQRYLKRIDSESKGNWLVGEVISKVSLAGQICEPYSAKRYGLDMEIEFKDDEGRPTAKKIYLQLKSGDSHINRRKRDGAEIFRIRHKDHADHWMQQAYPVFLVIANSQGEIRWMEIRDCLMRESGNSKKPLSQLVFTGEPFDVESIHSWRSRVLDQRSINQTKTGRPTRPLHAAGRRRRPPVRG